MVPAKNVAGTDMVFFSGPINHPETAQHTANDLRQRLQAGWQIRSEWVESGIYYARLVRSRAAAAEAALKVDQRLFAIAKKVDTTLSDVG